MTIFRRSKKSREATSQPQGNPIYDSRLNLREQYTDTNQSALNGPEHIYPMSNAYVEAPSQPWSTPQRPIHITQNFLIAPPLPDRHQKSCKAINGLKLGSVSNLLASNGPEGVSIPRAGNNGAPFVTQYLNQGAALCDLISSKLDAVITLIDGEGFNGDENELRVVEPTQQLCQQEQPDNARRDLARSGKTRGLTNGPVTPTVCSTNYFAKVNLYANSSLPSNFRPMKLYVPTFPFLCLAAQYSENVYTKPRGQEKETHVDADWRLGTKAMVIKSVPMDDMNTIVFAIKGTQSFMDWAVNLNAAPVSPQGFLDDAGNLCHAGFLTVAKKMIIPVAARLRHLLQENPGRAKYSLLITGHSAGGAVAALLYSHMLSSNPETESELNVLMGCFKRVHCVSFGAPPISLLPLAKPSTTALRKSLFISFVNEGDPVTRADKAYVRSLLDLYTSPAPSQTHLETPRKQTQLTYGSWKSSSTLNMSKLKPSKKSNAKLAAKPRWPVPEATLSNAGLVVLLRSIPAPQSGSKKKVELQDRMNDGVVAQIVSDKILRGVVWGDPICHMMRLYARRIEVLATNAVMGRS
ncbi:Alpha/Beta hydrolase protein [Amylocarpus encephaloides]|uniref:Alpha/Beta hydrolase protein n=1 Tax=Amylocarpus encephaloides TaxID=45428 RepID=A0A9P8C0Y1_9HELO|nr:Alpha/Beta hydrolase protein [Amylocarpus encephaloides]